jgi:hypothetical protein
MEVMTQARKLIYYCYEIMMGTIYPQYFKITNVLTGILVNHIQ